MSLPDDLNNPKHDILPDGVRWQQERGQRRGWTSHAGRGLKDRNLR